MEIGHIWDYRVIVKDGRSCMYAIETVEMYVSGNQQTRDNTITTISYDFSMASNCELHDQTSRSGFIQLGANTVFFYTRRLKRQKTQS